MSANREPVHSAPDEGRRFPGGLVCRVSSESTGGEYCAFQFVSPPGDGVPLHVHAHEDELYYILEGTLEIRCGGKTYTAGVGSMAMLPRNVPHAFRNPGPTPCRILNVFIPGGFDAFVQELSELPAEDAQDNAKRNAIRGKYGIKMLEKE